MQYPRYESKHRQAKSVVEASKNFVNVSYTVSERHQFRMCALYYEGLYDTQKFKIPIEVLRKSDLKLSDSTESFLNSYVEESDLICKSLHFKSRQFLVNDMVVLERNDRLSIELGSIKAFLIKGNIVYAVIQRHYMSLSALGFLENVSSKDFLELINMETLLDNYPLHMKGTITKFIVVLHHHVSFDYGLRRI